MVHLLDQWKNFYFAVCYVLQLYVLKTSIFLFLLIITPLFSFTCVKNSCLVVGAPCVKFAPYGERKET